MCRVFQPHSQPSTRPFGAALYGSVRVDVSYVGESFSELRPDHPFFERIDDYDADESASAPRSISSSWNVDLFVNNVFDEVAINRVLSTEFGRGLALSAPPRTFGLSVGKSF